MDHKYAGNATVSGMQKVGIPYRAMFDFIPDAPEELQMQEGDVLEIIDHSTDWWTAISNGNRGLVPSNYLEPISGSFATGGPSEVPPNIESGPPTTPNQDTGYPAREIVPEPSITQEDIPSPTSSTRPARPTLPGLLSASSSSSPGSPSLPSASSGSNWIPVAHPPSPEGSGVASEKDGICVLPTKARALFDVTGVQPGELSYKAGDIIDVEIRSTMQVWCGRVGSQIGTFYLDSSVEPIMKERVRALWDYSSGTPEDLTFKAGDIIQIIGPSSLGTWWWHGWIEGKGIGTFPFNFVEPIDEEFGDSDSDEEFIPNKPIPKCLVRFRVLEDVDPLEDGMLTLRHGDVIDLVERQSTEKWVGRLKAQTGTFLLDNSVEPIMTDRVKALFDYTATIPEELDFSTGDIITVVGPSDESTFWWYGALDGRLGMFPLNFVDLVPDERGSNSDSEDWVDVPGRQPKTVKALHNFCSRDPQDLTFDKGDVINVLDSTDPQSWKGELNGVIGMFPRTYCEVISTGKESHPPEEYDTEVPPPMYSEPAESEDFHSTGWMGTVSDTKTPTTPGLSSFFPNTDAKDAEAITPVSENITPTPTVPDSPMSSYNLALLANIKVASSQKKLKDWLHMASALRKEGNQYRKEGRLQSAYVLLAKSANCILEKIPEHPNYGELNATQKANLTKNGEEIQATLDELEPVLDRLYEDYINPTKHKDLLVKALWNYESDDPDDLPFNQDDVIEVLDMPTSTSWWRGKLRGKIGIFPCNYVGSPYSENEPARTPNGLTLPSPKLSTITEVSTPKSDPLSVNISMTSSPTSYKNPPGLTHGAIATDKDKDTTLPWTPCFVRGLYHFTASESGELPFLRGDILEITSMQYGTWWTAKLRDQAGIVPANYVELIDLGGLLKRPQTDEKATPKVPVVKLPEDEHPQMKTPPVIIKEVVIEPKPIHQTIAPSSAKKKGPVRPPDTYALSTDRVFALHAWNSGRARELVLKKGDIVTVLERPYEHWWKGRLESNETIGIFPANFVDPVPGSQASAPGLSHQPKRKATMETDEGLVILRANIAKLFPLLQKFDITQDLADDTEIQDIYRDSSILRRRVLRLLEDQPRNDALIQLDASFQEVKEYYDLIMELSASRHGRKDGPTSPNLLNSSWGAGVGGFSGAAFVSEPDGELGSLPPVPSPIMPTPFRGPERRGTGGSTRMSLPPTPSPALSSARRTSFGFPKATAAWPTSLASLENTSNANPRYEGRMSLIAADIERARAGYGASRSRSDDRRLPPSPAVRSLLRPAGILPSRSTRGAPPKKNKKKTSADSAQNKNIYRREVEYQHQHIMHYTPHRRAGHA